MPKLLRSDRHPYPEPLGGDVECARFCGSIMSITTDHQVQRGHAGTLKQWRNFVVKPIKQGQRREGMASDVVTSIVSSQSHTRRIAE
jgi:hypothetical protein